MQGLMRKLKGIHKSPIEYVLPLGDETIPLNEKMGQTIRLEFIGKIEEAGDRKKQELIQI